MAITIDIDKNDGPRVAAPGVGLEPPVREVKPAPDRFRNSIGKYRVWRNEACVHCGKCIEVCPRGVHVKPEGYADFLTGQDWRCTAELCKQNGTYCVDRCPQKALRIELQPMYKAMGDYRWTADLILSTWHMAATGEVPDGEMDTAAAIRAVGSTRYHSSFPRMARAPTPARFRRRFRSIAAGITAPKSPSICRFTAEGCRSGR